MRGAAVSAHDITEQYWARKRLQLINHASAHIGSTLDVARTAQELADVAVPQFADFVCVDLLESVDRGEEPTLGLISGWVAFRRTAIKSILDGCPESALKPGDADSHPDCTAPARALAAGQAIRRSSAEADFARWLADDASLAQELGIHAVLAAPLIARGATVGVATFVRHATPEDFDEDDLLLADELASRAAVCVDNARRYTRERGTAAALQQALLPRSTPRQAAVEVASRYLPTGILAGVGGDWFDVIPLSSARVALVLQRSLF